MTSLSQQSTSAGVASTWLLVFLMMPIVAQLFLPPEAVSQGDLVLIHSLWFFGMGISGYWLWKTSSNQQFAIDEIDLGLLLVVIGGELSWLMLFVCGGQLRSGFYVQTGFLFVGTAVLLMRRFDKKVSQSLMLNALITSAVMASALGVYQHYIFYPDAINQVVPIIEQYDRVELSLQKFAEADSPYLLEKAKQQQVDLSQELLSYGIPLDDRAREMFLQRLRDSQEPFGFFALANSLGGFLACVLVLLTAIVWMQAEEHQIKAKVFLAGMLWLLVAYTLLLTKSRTAWVGTGLAVIGLLSSRIWQTGLRSMRSRLLFIGIPLILLLISGIAFATGSLDLEVFTEVGKSMSYRFQYWQGSWQMLMDSPWLGVGPGNFRQSYLKYKLPESSEEILDPHNLWLDCWSCGGLIALAGLILLFTSAIYHHSQPQRIDISDTSLEQPAAKYRYVMLGGSFLLAGLLIPVETARAGIMTLLWSFVAVGVSGGVSWLLIDEKLTRSVFFWASGALLIHLQAAGGYAMPIILLLVLWLVVMNLPVQKRLEITGRSTVLFLTIIALGGLFTNLWLGVPFRLSESSALTMASATRSEQVYQTTIAKWQETDFWNPSPALQLGQHYRQQFSQHVSEESFKQAITALQSAIRRDPHSAHGYVELAHTYYEYYLMTNLNEHIDSAIAAQQQAIDRYPTEPEYLFEMARFLSINDQIEEAREIAELTLKLDQINRQAGHTDRFLEQEQVKYLTILIEPATPSPTGDNFPRK